jgi:hypothetical protein
VVVVSRVDAASSARFLSSYSSVQRFDSRAESFYYFSNAPYLVKLDLQLVNLPQDLPKACDLLVGHLDRVASTIVLHLCCGLCLSGELRGKHGQLSYSTGARAEDAGRRYGGREWRGFGRGCKRKTQGLCLQKPSAAGSNTSNGQSEH